MNDSITACEHEPSNLRPCRKRITLATFKAFVRRNDGRLFIKVRSSFDSMVDGVRHDPAAVFAPAVTGEAHHKNTLGIRGVWLVGSSCDSFNSYSRDGWTGFEVYNCCGTFIVATKD